MRRMNFKDYLSISSLNVLALILTLLLTSCSKEDMIDPLELDPTNTSVFYIDEATQPDLYQDSDGYYHIQFNGPRYFTIKGELEEEKVPEFVNGVPLTETSFDTDYWIWIEGLTFTVPLYSPFASFADDLFYVPIPVGNMILRICDLVKGGEIFNIAGYTYNEKVCGNCPYSGFNMGTYSKNTLNPQQNIYLDQTMKGDTLKVFVKTKYNYDLDSALESTGGEILEEVLNIIVD
tara:strand:+ start:3861 stop:4562 length:702 start_codon:yes stop_codon:yes gene_type:complete